MIVRLSKTHLFSLFRKMGSPGPALTIFMVGNKEYQKDLILISSAQVPLSQNSRMGSFATTRPSGIRNEMRAFPSISYASYGQLFQYQSSAWWKHYSTSLTRVSISLMKKKFLEFESPHLNSAERDRSKQSIAPIPWLLADLYRIFGCLLLGGLFGQFIVETTKVEVGGWVKSRLIFSQLFWLEIAQSFQNTF